MNTRMLARTTLVAAAAQVAMVVAGHYSAPIRDLFAFGGLTISLLAGLAYARIAAGGWASSLVGGVLAGGACAFLGIGASVLLRDTPPSLLAVGTAGSAVTGLIGGAIGRLLAPRSSTAG